jgi:iron-sulfur cluster repair protein YtfE (RIC family)
MVEEGTPNPNGEMLVEELAWIHGIIRENLASIQMLTDAVSSGAPIEQVQEQLKELSVTNIVWTLRTGCLRYCSLVHSHHHGEDSHFFPGLRRLNPALRPVIDKLEADHVAIAQHLDNVESAARRIGNEEAARVELAEALVGLSDHLLTHLSYEEENLNPTLRRLQAWPLG